MIDVFKKWVIDDLTGADIKKLYEDDKMLFLGITTNEAFFEVRAYEQQNLMVCIYYCKTDCHPDDVGVGLEIVNGKLIKETWDKIYRRIK